MAEILKLEKVKSTSHRGLLIQVSRNKEDEDLKNIEGKSIGSISFYISNNTEMTICLVRERRLNEEHEVYAQAPLLHHLFFLSCNDFVPKNCYLCGHHNTNS